MSYNGSGTYSAPALPGSWNPATAGSLASPTDWNTLLADFALAWSNVICRDGQSTITADLPMATHKHTGVGNATARDSYASAAQVQDGSVIYIAAGGTADALTLTYAPAITAYAVGAWLHFKATATNLTTTTTANVNAVGAGTITWPDGSALRAGDIKNGGFYALAVASATPTFHLQTVGSPPKIESRTAVADANYVVLSSDSLIAYTSLSASRTVTLPAASTFAGGRRLVIIDESGSASQTVALSLIPNGTDTIAGSNTTQVIINIPRGRIELECNGTTGWFVVSEWSVVYTNSLSGNVPVNSMVAYVDGPSVAQGTVGAWEASGAITIVDAGASDIDVVLWDGTNVVDSTAPTLAGANIYTSITLAGIRLSAPAGNLRFSVKGVTTATSTMVFNRSGNSKDCTITVRRVS